MPLCALVVLALGACADADPPTQVSAGGDPAQTTTSDASVAATSGPATTTTIATTAATSTSTTLATAATTSTTAAPATGPAAPSPVAGLDADQLQAALAAPSAATTRSTGPTVDQVALADGTRVWRVRVPGDFDARSARVAISVGGRTVGEGVQAPDLAAITAVTTDGSGLVAGRLVSYRWEGGPSVAAGNLVVVR